MQNTATLHEALAGIKKHLEEEQIVLDGELEKPFEFDGIPYGTHKEGHYPILTKKGKPTKKYFHVTLTRMDSGMYEPVFYVL